MIEYKIKITLKSPALIGSGTGYGAVIDTDVVYDELGIPYIPAKRIKGCLLDAAKDVNDMFELSEINKIPGMGINPILTFGKEGEQEEAPVYFSDLTIEQYKENSDWLAYFTNSSDYKGLLSKDVIIDMFTEERQQTTIKNGVAKKNSLRTCRVVKKGYVFTGAIKINNDKEIDTDVIKNTLMAACMNFKNLGTKRNKGLGEIKCELFEDDKKLSFSDKLEGLL